jgi:hypothetical protein
MSMCVRFVLLFKRSNDMELIAEKPTHPILNLATRARQNIKRIEGLQVEN